MNALRYDRPLQSARYALILTTLALAGGYAFAQTSGNIGYGQNGSKVRAEQNERSQRTLSAQDLPPTDVSMFVDADVLMNVKADEYVAVFGISHEGATVQEAGEKMSANIAEFTKALKVLHVRDSDIYVDFITQPKIYGYELTESSAKEKLAGFELKKTVSIHYSDRDLIDKLVVAAANAQIYDLIKVDYVVKDIGAVQDKLRTEAAAVVKQKLASYEKLLGIKAIPSIEVYADRTATYYPTQMYDAYTAAESESLTRPPNLAKYTVLRARKGQTLFFNALDGNGFDKIINPVVIEPVVQFTLYLKVKYDVAR